MSGGSATAFRPVSLLGPTNAQITAENGDIDASDLLRCARADFPDDENWLSFFATPCSFLPTHFHHVMENLLRNPNLTSSCLFRADILYDSDKDPDADVSDAPKELSGLLKYFKAELRPRSRPAFGTFIKHRVVVRNLVPRNPSLDKELVQTVCLLSTSSFNEVATHVGPATETAEEVQQFMVIYIPHADNEEQVPYYHPKVHSLALLHTFKPASQTGYLSVHYRLFSNIMSDLEASDEALLAQPSISKRLERTALNLLRIINKHAHGQQAGYKKRVHHDLLVDQVSFQNRYVKLKQKYAKSLLDTWAEVTDPKKHVFEDIGIAAFLIEVWHGMYGNSKRRSSPSDRLSLRNEQQKQPSFPGFVDIGCGNGVLVHLLISEGYEGWGFDIRQRKSWSVFPAHVQEHLKELILAPEVLQSRVDSHESLEFLRSAGIHNGIFDPGTFIVSNHADQLTPWTPLLAYASNSPFISIPCCSHALNGKLSRFYNVMPARNNSDALPATNDSDASFSSKASTASHTGLSSSPQNNNNNNNNTSNTNTSRSQATGSDDAGSKTGRLAHENSQAGKPAMPSAYAGFTAYVMSLAKSLDFEVESEVLRIPSTRNFSIVTRKGPKVPENSTLEDRNSKVLRLLEAEIGDVSQAAREWVEGAISLKRKAGGGH